MSKQQKNSAFVKMLKEFPKVFGRVSFRERLMLRTAFDYINEEVIADIKANCDLAIEGRDVKIMELEAENNKLLDVINNQDVKIADLGKQITALEAKNIELSENWRADHDTLVFYDEKLEKENAELKGRTEAFEKQILGLLYKYESVYKRFPDLKDAMSEADGFPCRN